MEKPRIKLKSNTASRKAMAFSFGDPEPVLDGRIADYLGVFASEHKQYYEPPVSQEGLIKTLRANAHHCTIPYFKRDRLVQHFNPSDTLNPFELGAAAFEYFVFGHCYFQKILNPFKQLLRYKHIPALNMRRLLQADRYGMLGKNDVINKYKKGEIVQLKEYDPVQSIYGAPQYLGGIQSVLLNESATLFRRRYYNNGAHMGYVFYTADANLDEDDETALKEQISQSKGVGNFRSMFLNVPGGKPDSVKIIPVGDIATKDEFERIKNLSRNDILSMWRIQPALAGIMPENNAGFGDVEKIQRMYFENEVVPIQQVFLQLNENLPRARHISFNNPHTEKD